MKSSHVRFAMFTMVGFVSLSCASEPAFAQLFGQRSLGQPLSRRSGPVGSSTEVGTLRGNERFMRDNRSRNDFVGPSRTSQDGFVGSEQAIGVGRVPTAAESVRRVADPSRRVNRPLPPVKANQPYYPNLVLEASPLPNFNDANRDGEIVNRRNNQATVDARLTSRLASENPSVRVLRDGRSATLIGEVNDPQQAARLRLLLSFEPGVYSINDRLVVKQPQ